MHQLTVIFGPTGTTWAFLYKESTSIPSGALHAVVSGRDTGNYTEVSANAIEISDDFGQYASFNTSQLIAFQIEDLEISKLAHIERGLHQARVQAKAQQMAQADPVIKAAAMNRGSGLATLNPMGDGRFS